MSSSRSTETPISSSASGSGTRRCRSLVVISDMVRVISRTGRSVRPVAHQVTAAASNASSGTPRASSTTIATRARFRLWVSWLSDMVSSPACSVGGDLFEHRVPHELQKSEKILG